MRTTLVTACLLACFASSSGTFAQTAAPAGSPEDAAADAAIVRKAAEVTAILDRHLATSTAPRDQLLRRELQTSLGIARAFGGVTPVAKPSPATLKDIAARAPTDRLVQWAWASASATDAGCASPKACPGREHALARLEPGNAFAWFPVFAQAWDQDDDAGVDAALRDMAAATRYQDLFIERAAAWAEVQDRFPDYVAARSAAWSSQGVAYPTDIASIIAGIAYAAADAIPSMAGLVNSCDRGKHPEAAASRFERCATIGRLMQGKGASAMSHSIGVALIRRSVGLTAQDLADNRAFRWTMEQAGLGEMESNPEQTRAYFDDLFKSGDELTAMQRRVARLGRPAQPPAGWKAQGEEN